MKRPSGFDAGAAPGARDDARTPESLRAPGAPPRPTPTTPVAPRADSPDAAASVLDSAVVSGLDSGPEPDLAPRSPGGVSEGDPRHDRRVQLRGPVERAPSDNITTASARRPWGRLRGVGDPVRVAARRVQQAARSRRSRERLEQRRFTAHLRRRRRVWLISAGAVVALGLFVLAGVFTPLMAVREVQVVGASRLDPQEVASALSRFDGVPLALVADSEVHRALEPFPLIQRYAIERIPPHTLRVRLEERDPVIALEREGGFGLVDAAGVLVAETPERPEGVPLGAGTVVDTASPAFRAAAEIVRDLPADLRAQVGVATATTGQDVELSLASGTRVVWGDEEETQRKAVVLRAMMQALGPVAMIDLSSPESPVFQ